MAGINNLKERLNKNDKPDSYIMGASRSFVFRCDTWERFLNDQSKPFHFDAASETLFGVLGKIRFLDKQNIRIKNILLICDVSLLSKTANEYDVTHIKYPDISDESKFDYQVNYIKGYFTNFFFLKQIDYLLFKKEKNYMKDVFAIEPGYIRTESHKNDYYYEWRDSVLMKDSIAYYISKSDAFDERPATQKISDPVLKEKHIEMLKEIKRILDKDNTRIKIVISPVYDQKKINEADIKALTDIFGPNTVYDYSGKNEITDSKYNYYEASHFKPYIAEKIMADIYSK